MYVKKINQFLSSIKKDARKGKLVTFFCITVHIVVRRDRIYRLIELPASAYVIVRAAVTVFRFFRHAILHTRQGCSGAVTRGGRRPSFFFYRGTRPPLPHFFGLKFVQKLVHFCNWLLTETQCKIISVQQNNNIDLLQTLKHE